MNTRAKEAKDAIEALAVAAKTLTDLSELALDTAKRLGASDAKVDAQAARQKRLVVEAGQFSLANSLESRELGIVVHVDGKKGSASLNAANEAAVRKAVADAVTLARFSVPDEALTLASLEEAPAAPPLSFLFDQELAALSLEELQALMGEALVILTRDRRVALDRFEASVDLTWRGFASSRGVRQEERQSQAQWTFFGMGRDGDEVTGFDYDSGFAFRKADFTSRCRQEAEHFVRKIIGLFNSRSCPSYNGPVLFTPRAVQEILTPMALYHAGGRQVMDGKSRWGNAVDQAVTAATLTISDEPHASRFAGATAFDDDGVPTRPQAILTAGVLKRHLHDCYSAKRCRTRTTASAGGPFGLSVRQGNSSRAALQKSHDRMLLVDRFSGNLDPVKGDFSGVAKSSRLIEKGQDSGPVTETMVAANFFEIAHSILGASTEVEAVGGHSEAPYVLVDGISVTGSPT